MEFTHEDLPIVLYEKVATRKKCNVHAHNHYELYYLVNGNTKYFIGDEIFEVKKGDLVFVPKGLFHETDSGSCMHLERVLIFFDDNIFDSKTEELLKELRQQRVIHISESKAEYIERLFIKLKNEYMRGSSHSEILVKLYILEILTLVCRYRVEYKPHSQGANEDIYRISQYIRKNYSKEITLKSLSREFAISESHLSRRFKEVSGIGINEYITYVRIMNAEILLKNKKYPITEVAARCGYNDSNYFSTVFKKIKGITPLRFSKSNYED